MLVAFNPQCGCTTDIYLGWEVFGLFGGAWRPSTDGAHDIGLVNLTVSGATITEEREIQRSTDMFPWAPDRRPADARVELGRGVRSAGGGVGAERSRPSPRTPSRWSPARRAIARR